MPRERQRHSLSAEWEFGKIQLLLFHVSITARLIAENHGHHSVTRNEHRDMPVNAHA